MNNLTHKTFLALLFVAMSVTSWANTSSKDKENPNLRKTRQVVIPPAPPGVTYLGQDKCGFERAGNAASLVLLQTTGCGNGFITWYNAGDRGNLGRNTTGDKKFLDVLFDINVYAICTEFGEESAPSQTLFIKYLSAPSTQPFITRDNPNDVCDGQTITLKSSVNDRKFIYSWERGLGLERTPTLGFLINRDNATSGQGSPELKITKSGWYFLSVISPECPQVKVDGLGQIFVKFTEVQKPKIIASDTVFCEDKAVSLKADSSQFVTGYSWYVNGTKQDSLGTKSMIKTFNKTAKIQVQTTESTLGCTSPLSDAVSLRALRVPPKPVITPSKKGAAICQGDTLSLTSSLGFKYKWSTGATTPSIRNINAIGKYTVQVIDTSGCISKASDTTTITVFRLPTKPVISASGPIAFCSGGSVTLTSTPNTTYLWSNAATTRAITLSASGDFTVAVRDANLCLSPTSDPVKVTVYALPAKPTITAGGPLSFCADQSVILTASDLIGGERTRYRWNTSDSTKSLTVKTSAIFTVRVLDPRNCLSPSSDPITTIALPLPPAPTVTADGPLAFCARSNDDFTKPNTLNLVATIPSTSTNVITWNTGFVGKTLTLTAIGADGKFADISRDYTATVKDGVTGCISPKSTPLAVVVKDNPDVSASSIAKDGTFTLKAVNFPDGTDYEWRFGTEVLKFTEGVVKANRYGDYTARRKTVFTVPAPTNTLACFSNFVKPFTFKEDPDFKGLSIYPNPSNGLLTIETLADYDNAELIIYDLLGRLIYTATVPSVKGKLIVDLRNQTEGEYMLRFKANGFDLTKRIIIDR